MPVDEAQQSAGGEPTADQEGTRDDQHPFGMRQGRGEEGKERHCRGHGLDDADAVQFQRLGRDMGGALADPQAAAPDEGLDGVDDDQRGQRRRRADGDEGPEIEPADAGDQDVLRVADDGRGRAGIGGGGQGQDVGPGIEAGAGQADDQHGRHGKDHDIVGEHGRKPAADGRHQRQEQARRGRHGGEPGGAPGIEAAGGVLGREDHEAEEDDQRGKVDGGEHALSVHGPGEDEGDGTEQGHAGAIDHEAGQPAGGHAEIDDREDDEDERGHAGSPGAAPRLITRAIGSRKDQLVQ